MKCIIKIFLFVLIFQSCGLSKSGNYIVHGFDCIEGTPCAENIKDILRPYFLNKSFKIQFHKNFAEFTSNQMFFTLTKKDNGSYSNTVNWGNRIFEISVFDWEDKLVMRIKDKLSEANEKEKSRNRGVAWTDSKIIFEALLSKK